MLSSSIGSSSFLYVQLCMFRLGRSSLSYARTFSSKLPINTTGATTDVATHTGQKWDSADWRLQRFDVAPKMINPNVAAELVREKPAKDCGGERIVKCDGGHPALGHPAVFINLDKPGNHVCGYCGNRFFNSHVTKEEDRGVDHLNV